MRSLRAVDLGRPSRVVPLPGHYASVLRLDDRSGLALSTDTVGTKMVVAERLDRYDTIGIDCVAMNVNDVICVGAEPIAMLDFILTERADPAVCEQLGVGLARGAELAGIEIPGGEIAQVADIVTGHELGGTCVGLVELDAIVTGAAVEPGDPVIGLPSSGLHSNGYTLARRALGRDPVGRRTPRSPARRRAAGANRDLCSGGARAAPLPGRSSRARPHHRRRARQPAAARGRGRLRDRRPASRAPGVRPDPGAGAGLRRRDASRSSTWGAGSAAWSPTRTRARPWSC